MGEGKYMKKVQMIADIWYAIANVIQDDFFWIFDLWSQAGKHVLLPLWQRSTGNVYLLAGQHLEVNIAGTPLP